MRKISTGASPYEICGLEVLKIGMEKAETPEERMRFCEEIAKLMAFAREADAKNWGLVVTGFRYLGGAILLIGGTVILIRSPKLGMTILATATKMLGK